MQQSLPPASPAALPRWRPRWAFAVAIGALVLTLGTAGFGAFFIVSDLLDHSDMFDGLVAAIGVLIGVPGLLAAVPFVVFLARRGGKVPFFLGVGVVTAVVLWFWLAFGLRIL